MRNLLFAALILNAAPAMAESKSITAEVWVDNWFEMYVNGTKTLEDSVPITTEKSFNAETATFTATFPMTIAIMAKDFKENDTGLEYIGTARQQMGDGGMIAQFREATASSRSWYQWWASTPTGKIVGVTDAKTRCLVVQHAPVDRACAKESNPVAGQGPCGFVETPIPANWTAPDFDDSAWPLAVEHSASEVGPKGGYDDISWDASAKLIWSEDLVLDNTLLCRMKIGG